MGRDPFPIRVSRNNSVDENKRNGLQSSLSLSLSLRIRLTALGQEIHEGPGYVTGNAYSFSIRANLGEICRHACVTFHSLDL